MSEIPTSARNFGRTFSSGKRLRICLATAGLFFFGQIAIAQTSAQTSAQNPVQACTKIAQVYGQCRKSFEFDGRDFHFRNSEGSHSLPCEDGRNLDYYDRMENMDVASMLAIPYDGGLTKLPELRRNWDPGRLRVEDLFKSVYGATEGQVRANLVKVPFLNQEILFQKNLGAAKALSLVSRELLVAAAGDLELAKFLEPFTSGKTNLKLYGMNWRKVDGTDRMSTHSFGTAIDLLTTRQPQYWLWEEKKNHPGQAAAGEDGLKDVPIAPTKAPYFHPKAVEIFEKHGFIWGGKWNHFDTMHFEYRPEFYSGLTVNCSAN